MTNPPNSTARPDVSGTHGAEPENSDSVQPPQWFPVATKPRSEVIARDNLERQGFAVCAPTIQLRKRRKDGWQQVTEPMFPGYVFVALRLGVDDIAPIRSTRGCLSLVRFGGAHVPVPDSVMQPLLQLGASAQEAAEDFKVGERVRIEDGPFAGVEAVFQMKKGEDRVQLLITMLGKAQSVWVDGRWVAKAE